MVERLHHQQATLTNSMLVSLLINQGNVIILIQLHYINLPFICSIFQAYQLEVKTKLFQKIWPLQKTNIWLPWMDSHKHRQNCLKVSLKTKDLPGSKRLNK